MGLISYLKEELKNFVEELPYIKRLTGTTLIAAGSFLLMEHVYHWGFELLDLIGHEWFGLVLILVGVVINLK